MIVIGGWIGEFCFGGERLIDVSSVILFKAKWNDDDNKRGAKKGLRMAKAF